MPPRDPKKGYGYWRGGRYIIPGLGYIGPAEPPTREQQEAIDRIASGKDPVVDLDDFLKDTKRYLKEMKKN